MAAVIIGNPTTESPSYLGSIEVTGVMPVGSTPPEYSGSIEVPGAIPIGSSPISRGETIVPTYYTKTQLQTSGQSEVHWGNLTNVPDFTTTLADLTDVDLTGLVNGDIIKYNSITTNWEAAEDEGYTDAEAVAAIKADSAWKATNWDTAYGWGNHSGLYDLAGSAAAVTPTSLGLVIGTNVLAQRTFGTAANSATTDFAPALGIDDNYVTNAEKTVIGNTSGANTGDQDLSALAKKTTEVTVTTARTTAAKIGTTAGGSYTPTYGDVINVTFTLGCAVSSPTLNIDGSGVKSIYLDTVVVSTTLLSTGAVSTTVPLWYDGTYWQMYGSHLNTNTTYTEITEAEITAGTASTLRTTSGRRAAYIISKSTPIEHATNTSNPHSVTATQVSLGNVTNESKATMFTNPTFTGYGWLTGSTPYFYIGDGAAQAKMLILGYNHVSNYGIIESIHDGVEYRPLALQPNGGNVGIGTTNPTLLFQVGSRGGMDTSGVFYWGSALTGNNRGVLSWDTDLASITSPVKLSLRIGSTERLNLTSTGAAVTGTVTATSTFTGTGFEINTAAGVGARVNSYSSGSIRWSFGKTTEAESGSNAGSNFAIYNYADNGTYLGTPFVITRATGVVTFSSAVVSASTFTGTDFIQSSDIRLKQNIKPLSLEPVDIEYKQFEFISQPGVTLYGVIAQDLQKTNPELVRTDEKGILSVSYMSLFAKEIASLKARVTELEMRLNNG